MGFRKHRQLAALPAAALARRDRGWMPARPDRSGPPPACGATGRARKARHRGRGAQGRSSPEHPGARGLVRYRREPDRDAPGRRAVRRLGFQPRACILSGRAGGLSGQRPSRAQPCAHLRGDGPACRGDRALPKRGEGGRGGDEAAKSARDALSRLGVR